jgi:hypothetical protein
MVVCFASAHCSEAYMRFASSAVVIAATCLGSCSSVANFDLPNGYKGVTVRQIVDKIDCEISVAKNDNDQLRLKLDDPRNLNNWIAAVILTLQVDDGTGLQPTLTFIDPLRVAGTSFSFMATAQLSGSRQRVYTQTYSIDVSKVTSDSCNRDWERFDLQGDLGIKEIAYMGLHALGSEATAYNATKDGKATDSIAGTIQFVLTKNVSSVGPMWTLVHFKGPGGLFGASRVNTHKIAIAFAPNKRVPGGGRMARALALTLPGGAGDVARAAAANANLNATISTLSTSLKTGF